MKKITAISFLLLFFFSLTSCFSKKDSSNSSAMKIGLSIDTIIIERWKRDLDSFVAKAKENGAEVLVQDASNSVTEQINQIDFLINQGVKALVIVPKEADSLTEVVQKAKNRGIPVISYDRLIRNADIDLYVSVNSRSVGKKMAESILQVLPEGSCFCIYGSQDDFNMTLMDKGVRDGFDNSPFTLDLRYFTPDWNYDLAYQKMSSLLEKNLVPSAVICGNDAIAESVLRSIFEHKIEKNIPVVGQDADILACRRILQGTQLASVYKPIDLLAETASEYACFLAAGKELPQNAGLELIDNGYAEIPVCWLEPVLVDSSNIDEVIIGSDFHSRAEIYR